MGFLDALTGALRGTSQVPDVADFHRRLLDARFRLNNAIFARLPRESLNRGAHRLGMLQGRAIEYGDENELSVLMDYCIYDVFIRGHNAVEQYAIDFPPLPGSDEYANLEAMRSSRYTLIVVLELAPGVGCQIYDMFADESRFLADVGFSNTAEPGMLVATRLLDFGDFVTTSGAALPLGPPDDAVKREWLKVIEECADVQDFDPAELIQMCFASGGASAIRYASPNGYEESNADAASRTRDENTPTVFTARPKRKGAMRSGIAKANRRCRCGSGKMFKNCCGKGRQRTEGT
jgi:hypothetical protein